MIGSGNEDPHLHFAEYIGEEISCPGGAYGGSGFAEIQAFAYLLER